MKSGNENILIRLATDDDFETIYSIWLDGIKNSYDDTSIDPQTLKEKFSSNFNQRQGIFNFWVAVDAENKIWGWQSLVRCLNHPFKDNTYAESSTYLSIENRFKGLGKLLLGYVLKEAEKSSLEYVIGFVATNNVAAIKITKATGWIEVGIMPPSKSCKSKLTKLFLVRPV